LFSFFYHLLRSTFFSIIFVFDGYFSLRSTYLCSNSLFDEFFAYRSTFLCCRHWLDQAFFLKYVVRWIFFTHIYSSFKLFFVLTSSWPSRIKEGNKFFFFCTFFYHLLSSSFLICFRSFTIFSDLFFFSIIFVFDGYFFVRYTYFCSIIFFDEYLAFRSTFLCCRYWFDRVFFLRFVVRWIFYSHILFSFSLFFALRFLMTFMKIICKRVDFYWTKIILFFKKF